MTHAIVIPKVGGPEVLKTQDHSRPAPADRQVVIRNRAAAVNFIDTIIRRGEMPDGMMPALPHIPGVEGAGIVEAVGTGVDGIVAGDHVAWTGPVGSDGYSTYSVLEARYVTKIPKTLDFTTAASIPVNAVTAWHMLVNLGAASAGKTVLIHTAAGGVGTMAVQMAKHLGMTVIASTSSGKLEFAKAQGADHVIDYRNEDVTARVMELTAGRGVDLSLNPISGETLKSDLEALAPLGTVVLFGFLAGPPVGTFQEDLAQHFGKSVAVRVSDIFAYSTNYPAAYNADLNNVFKLLQQGVLRPQIAVLPFCDAAEAHRRLEAGESMGKLVLTID